MPSPRPGGEGVAGRKATLAQLRQSLAQFQGGHGGLPFGLAAIDAALPEGLARGALHEVSGLGAAAEEAAEATAFLAGILARLAPERPVLWCLKRRDLHVLGLARHGLKPGRLILAEARGAAELLWAMEEGLKCRALAAVVGELDGLTLAASRRLQLAAEGSGVTAFVLNRHSRSAVVPLMMAAARPVAAVTRWRIAALPGRPKGEPGLAPERWLVELWRCRGGVPARWMVEACDATGHVLGADELADRPLAPAWRAAG